MAAPWHAAPARSNPDNLTGAFSLVDLVDGAGNGSSTLPALNVPPALIGRTLSSVALTFQTVFDFSNDENVRLLP